MGLDRMLCLATRRCSSPLGELHSKCKKRAIRRADREICCCRPCSAS